MLITAFDESEESMQDYILADEVLLFLQIALLLNITKLDIQTDASVGVELWFVGDVRIAC